MKHSLRAVALKPDDATIQRHLGMIHAVKAQLEPALKRMDEAIRLDAADAESYVERGNVHAQMGNHEKAIADINRAIQLSPNTAAFYESRGSVTAARNDHEGAIRDFSEALRLDPALTSAYARRGQVHLQAADFNAAVRDFEAAIGRDRRAATAEQYNGRGFAFLQLGDLDRAIADFDEAIRLDSRLAASYANRGNAWRKKGDPERAIGDLSDALRYDSSMTSAYVDRGLAFEAKGDRERARSDFNAALARPIGASAAARTALDIARARLAALTAATSTAAATSSTPAPAQRRIALVIGNSAYKSVPALPNPRRDAERVATTLRAVGFQAVTLQGDLTREKLVDALRAFARAADTADWALVYFAGHGIEIGGVNYLIPVDARLESDRDAPLDAVPLEQVLGAVEGARKLRLVLLDACRDNPFANQMRRTSASRSVGRGLARVEPGAGTMIAYAAKHGSLAFDGDGNSPFATALIKRLQVPGIELRRLFDLVRDDVVDATGGRQEPFTYGSLSGREDSYFVSK
jgi:tetratricopeptide (TPR) repeat protein